MADLSIKETLNNTDSQTEADKESKGINTSSSIFREKSLEAVENPEQLNDYLKVTSPGVWIVLGAVIAILAGVVIWGFYGKIDATTSAAVVSQGGETYCLVPEAALQGVIENKTVRVDGQDLALEPSVLKPEAVTETTDVYVRLAGKLNVGDIVYQIPLSEPLEEGVYTGTLVTETLSPVKLFF